ncbi:hypothetical protein CYMTET_2810 [Cymbomonas tetramitiformis]|uniref:Uncharacterized protein n=1 Tax=Cymbomonas tetramitiformis TaxID=36881 RepID=A0AAE0LM04_9CHLO|nr:hypothetical protein CYMTET_2810 [Cymbomonas tetramitiformis]
MLSHFTSRNLELMRRKRKLWLLLDLHGIELQASNGGGTVLAGPILVPGTGGAVARGGDRRAPAQGPLHYFPVCLKGPSCSEPPAGTPACFISPAPSELPLTWKGSGDGTDRHQEHKKYDEVRPGDKIKIFWLENWECYPGIVGATSDDGRTTITYDNGDVENIVLKEERYRVPHFVTTEEQQQEVRSTPWRTALLQHLTGELGDNKYSDTATVMQASTLQRSTTSG